ncbi:AraC family transcriptional regulator [uncultured Streptococcus sp.]|uniref:AraC family transcriptional regulator n=1 Tax=uncultured Streptococcus sp. TaxID=83427 RepID=UPI002675867F|nr:AraC family transcriptional regulator [uncultured Streptococcus sp.]
MTTNSEHKSLLPYDYYRTVVESGRPDILFHWHPEIEINYIYEGSARFHIDYDYFDSQAGDIILIRPNGMHSIHLLENQTHVTDTFRFHLDMIGHSTVDHVSIRYLQPLQSSLYQFVPRIQPGMGGYDEIKRCLFTIFELSANKDRHFELSLKSKINEFLYLLFYHHYVVQKTTDDAYRKNEQIRQLIDHINHNYQKNLSIDYLSHFMGYSKSHFMTLFKQQTGVSCTEFVIQVRLNKASELLINTSHSILDIATDVGFNNLSNFNRQFKRYYQLTPSQYRKKFTHSHKS